MIEDVGVFVGDDKTKEPETEDVVRTEEADVVGEGIAEPERQVQADDIADGESLHIET
jgi:hypothetical protein